MLGYNGLFYVVLVYASFSFTKEAYTQTCCTGSAPITGSIRIATIDEKQWNINLIADHNNISDLVLADENVNEDFISRAANTVLLQTNYGFTSRFSASLVIPYIHKSEQTKTLNNTNKVSTDALGDISLLLQYALVNKESFSVLLGSGIKLATGPTQLIDSESQILLQPSLQPGTGSYDYLFLTQIQYSMPFRHSLSISQAFTYQLTGTSTRFASHDSYKFGDEFQSFTTITDQFVLLNKVFTPSIMLRVSARESNVIEQFEDVNSGGLWAYLSPGALMQINSTLSLLVQADLPVYSNVNGFQLTTSYIIRGGVLISI